MWSRPVPVLLVQCIGRMSYISFSWDPTPTSFQNSWRRKGCSFDQIWSICHEERAWKVVLFRVQCGRVNPVGHSGVTGVNGRFASD